jgi:single-strand DNA-binding protein
MSAPNINSVTLVGRLTAEPLLRQLPDGRSVCDLRLAVNDQPDKPAFIDVSTFGPGADACAEHLGKGRQVGVIGRLSYSEWENNDGKKRSKHEVVGRISFGGGAAESDGNQVAAGDGRGSDE